MRYHYWTAVILQKIGYIIFWPIHRFFFHLEINGKDNLKELNSPIIFAPNHTSELDVTAIPQILSFFSKFFPIYFVCNPPKEYVKSFGLRGYFYGGKFFELLGGYPIFQGTGDYEKSLTHHLNLLKLKRNICIFPEGKRTRDGNINPARGGLGYLVYKTEATVIPIAINTFFGITKEDFWNRKRRVIINILKPIARNEFFPDANKIPQTEDFHSVGDKVLDRIKSLLNTNSK